MRWLLLAGVLAACATTPRPKAAPPTELQSPTPAPSAPYVRSAVPMGLPQIPRTRPVARTKTLKNGLKVVVVEDHRARLVKTRLLFSTGSAADQEDAAGATYFALALLGDTYDELDADERPRRMLEKSARYLAMMAGSQLMFDVTPDSSWIGIDGYSVDTATILRRLDAVITAQRHGEFSFQGRVQSTVDIVNELELTDGLVLEQYLTQLAFGETHLYARPVFGTPKSLGKLGLEDVIERQQALLTPAGTTLLVAGDVQADEIFRRVQESFGDWKGTANPLTVVPPPKVTRRRSVVFLPRKPSRNTLICLTRPLSDLQASASATQLALAVLGEARISATLREKLGMTYSVTSAMVERRSARALLICTRAKGVDTIDATRRILEEVSELERRPPTLAELEHARAMAISQAEMEQDDLNGIVSAWQQAAVMRQPAPPETKVEELRKVTVEDLLAVSKKLAALDSMQLIFSGERPLVEAAARANALGPLKVPVLGRVAE